MNTLKPLSLALLLLALPAGGAGTNSTITVGWNWPLPQDMGGLTVPDFLTNVSFRAYSATNIANPQWQPGIVFASTNYTFTPPDNFTAILPLQTTNSVTFYVLTAVTYGGESSFSEALTAVAAPVSGFNFRKR